VAPALPARAVYAELGLRFAQEELLLREGLLMRLREAQSTLPAPFSLLVLDGWRPLALQRELLRHYEAERGPISGYVADPDGGSPPPHTTGGAVDLTLAHEGVGLALGTDYDDFTERAHPAALEGAGETAAGQLRRLLTASLSAAGLIVHPLEWWHWSYGDAVWSAATKEPTCYELVACR
jgi:D-alanyl-D-alanine dipeptidase